MAVGCITNLYAHETLVTKHHFIHSCDFPFWTLTLDADMTGRTKNYSYKAYSCDPKVFLVSLNSDTVTIPSFQDMQTQLYTRIFLLLTLVYTIAICGT